MSDQPSSDCGPARRFTSAWPWYRRLASQRLSEATVVAPSGKSYLVRLYRNSPVIGPRGDDSDATGAVLGLIKANVQAGGRTGWRIEVLLPPTRWRSERGLYTQQIGAEPIVDDVLAAITKALERGDKLWSEEDE